MGGQTRIGKPTRKGDSQRWWKGGRGLAIAQRPWTVVCRLDAHEIPARACTDTIRDRVATVNEL